MSALPEYVVAGACFFVAVACIVRSLQLHDWRWVVSAASWLYLCIIYVLSMTFNWSVESRIAYVRAGIVSIAITTIGNLAAVFYWRWKYKSEPPRREK